MYRSGTPEEVIYIYLHHFTYLSGAPEGVIYIYLHHFMYLSGTPGKKCHGNHKYRTEVEEYEGTVIYRTLLFYNSVFLGRYEKKTYLNLLLFFSPFYNSGLFYN